MGFAGSSVSRASTRLLRGPRQPSARARSWGCICHVPGHRPWGVLHLCVRREAGEWSPAGLVETGWWDRSVICCFLREGVHLCLRKGLEGNFQAVSVRNAESANQPLASVPCVGLQVSSALVSLQGEGFAQSPVFSKCKASHSRPIQG